MLVERGCSAGMIGAVGFAKWVLSPARSFGENVLQGVVAVCLEVIVGGEDAVEVVAEDDGKSEIVERDIVGGAVSGAREAGVLAEGSVSAAVVSVLDRPMPAVEGEEAFGGGLFGGEGSDSVGAGDGPVAGLDVPSPPRDAEHLLHVEEGEQAFERSDAFDGARVEATVERLLGSVGELPLRLTLPVGVQQGLMGLGSVAPDREQVVGTVRPQDGIGGVAGGVQRIHGDHGTAEADVFQEREHRGVLAARFMAHPAGHRPATGRPCAWVTSVAVS